MKLIIFMMFPDVAVSIAHLRFVVFFSVDVMSQIDIPSVFVSEESATSLKDYYYETG